MEFRIGWIVGIMIIAISGAFSGIGRAELPPLQAKSYPLQGPRPPWRARTGKWHEHLGPRWQGLIDLTQWPAEPISPYPVLLERFAPALSVLCSANRPHAQIVKYATWILESSKAFDVDPFLLASLIYRQSRCNPNPKKGRRIGLTRIDYKVHERFVHRGNYHYWILRNNRWVPRRLRIDRFPFTAGALLRDRTNIYMAAALLHVYRQQCPDIDMRFRSVPHRHYVSHFFWGDRVMETGPEDLVLSDRRRLIEYYTNKTPKMIGRFRGLTLRCPVDGVPRKIMSGLGNVRAGGERSHKGVDFVSTSGEPVRAVADGWVTYAGVDLPKAGARRVPFDRSGAVRKRGMGPGGLFVMVEHKNGLVSAYMHLSTYTVRGGEFVRKGALLGYVGRTGIKVSAPHLHFEFRYRDRILDPAVLLRPCSFPPRASYRGRYIKAAQPAAWRRVRYRKRRARLKRRKSTDDDR